MLIIPDKIIFETLKSVIKLIRDDYKNCLFTGTVASGTVNIVSGKIDTITIDSGGVGYPFPPLIEILGDGSGAEAICKITNGVVTSIEITNQGSGYTNSTVVFKVDETKSIIYRLLESNNIQRYKLYQECVALLITNDEQSARHLDINLYFNAARAAIPTIHITLPAENEKNNAINNSEGFVDPIFEENNETYIKTFNRRFSTRYNIIFTSDNTNEVILMYHFFKSILISLSGHFNVSGLENTKLSGGDIQISQDIIPLGIFTRALSLEFEYDTEGQDLFRSQMNTFDIVGVEIIPIIESNT